MSVDFDNWRSKHILDAVEEWAAGKWMLIRETGIVWVGGECGKTPEEAVIKSNGRLDGLLVPISADADSMVRLTKEYFWNRVRLIGVEVKINRSDFMRGMKSGQFERYDAALGGLYVATPLGVCKSSELPKGVGHLVVTTKRRTAVACMRRPELRTATYDPDVPWRLLFYCAKQMRNQQVEESRKYDRITERFGRQFGAKLAALVDEMRAGEAR